VRVGAGGLNCGASVLSADDRQDERGQFQRSPTGPWVRPQRPPANQPTAPTPRSRNSRRHLWSVVLFVVVAASIGVRAFRDISRPEAWDYWKELYVSPSLTSSLVASANLNGTAGGRPALAISGKIGVASASWFRARLDEANLAAGDTILMSSPGGSLDQAIIMGEIIRSRGLATAVGIVDGSGSIKPSFCASACVFVYAGGQPRLGVDGSALGVHRFVSSGTAGDPVAETQRTTGMILSYLTRMGVSPSIVEAMSQTSDIRWLGPREMTAMNLVTAPSRAP
jgi:hypothetical protein